jgi:hypothetical protein
MPDSYVNPDRKIVDGGLKWFPEKVPSTNGYVTQGWSFLTLVRGKFRNDYYVSSTDSSISVNLSGNILNSTNNLYDPINAAFRKLQTLNKNVKTSKRPLIFQSSSFEYEISLNTSSLVSGITITYAYVVDIFSENLIGFIEQSNADGAAEDIVKILDYRQNPSFNSIDVDWSKYSFVKINAYTSNDETSAVRWPSDKSELKASGFYNGSYESVQGYTETFIKFSDGINKTDFKTIKKIKIMSDAPVSIKFAIKKIKLYNWGRVNFPKKNLPCSHLSYAIPIDIAAPVVDTLDKSSYPSSPLPFSIKLFNPDDTISGRGFAHAIDIHFLIAGFVDALSVFLGFTNVWVFFVGPMLGKKSSIFFLEPTKSTGIDGLLIRVNNQTIEQWADLFVIQKIESDTAPNDESNWQFLFSLSKSGSIIERLGEVNEVSAFLIHDLKGTDTSWYRVLQINTPSGTTTNGNPFHGSIYTEKSLLNLNTTGISNSTPLTVIRTSVPQENFNLDSEQPIAIFKIDNITDLFTNNLVFKNGQIKFLFSAKSYDPSFKFSSHVYLRMWFHPGSEEIDFNDPAKYRSSETEMIIQNYVANGKNKSKIVFGTPTSLNDLIISAPLLNESNNFSIIKFVDGLPDHNNNYSPFSNQSTVNLVVAIYVSTVLNGTDTSNLATMTNVPNNQITFDVNSTVLELPIIKTTAGALSVSRFLDYSNVINSSNQSLTCKLSNLTYVDDTITSSTYFEYNRTITQIDSVNDSENYAYADLLSLREGTVTPQKIFAKIPKYSLTDNNSVFYFIDFATYFNTFINTKVNQGTLNVEIKFDIDADNEVIINKIKLAGFFVSRYGKILERIFISNFETLPKKSEDGKFSINKNININIPFYVSDGDCQIILRVYYYPYSDSGIIISNDEWVQIKRILDGKPDGIRIDDISLNFSAGIFSSSINTSISGTVNYEDLQLIPAQSLDSQQFWFVGQDQKLHAQYLTTNDTFKMQGAVYSPTWLIDLPENMEVDTRFNSAIIPSNAQDITSANVVFRTVPTDVTSTDSRLTAVQNADNKPSVHIAKTKPVNPFDIVTQSYSTNVSTYVQLANPLFAPTFSADITGKNSVSFKGNYPDLFKIKHNNSNYGFSISVGDADSDSGFNKIATNGADGFNEGKWYVPNSSQSFDQTLLTKFTSDLSKTSMFQDKISKNIFAAGFAKPGSIIVKTFNLFNPGTAQTTNAQGQAVTKIISNNYLIDGSSTTSYDTDQPLVVPNEISGLNATETFTGLSIDEKGNALVAYALQGDSNVIYGRIILSTTKQITNAFKLVNMGSISKSELLNVYCPVVKYYNSMYHLVFYCAGKLFYTSFANLPSNKSSFQFPTNPVTLIAGNPDFDNSNNKAHPFLKALQSKNKLLLKYKTNNLEEVDLKMQAAAFVIAENDKNRGQLFIYYTLPSGITMGRQILFGGSISEPYKISD